MNENTNQKEIDKIYEENLKEAVYLSYLQDLKGERKIFNTHSPRMIIVLRIKFCKIPTLNKRW
jgi:hypothetical protein